MMFHSWRCALRATPRATRLLVTSEQGDVLIKDVSLSASVQRGDVLAIPATGAYGFSMASNYNRFPRPPVLAVADGRARVIVRRETYDDLVARDEPA